MKCPYCGGEMEQGVIQSPHEICWKHEKAFLGNAEFNEDAVILSELSMLRGSAAEAFRCRACEKIVIDYKNGDCDMNRRAGLSSDFAVVRKMFRKRS